MVLPGNLNTWVSEQWRQGGPSRRWRRCVFLVVAIELEGHGPSATLVNRRCIRSLRCLVLDAKIAI